MDDDRRVDLVAVCDHCLTAVADGDGVLEVDAALADRRLRAWRAQVGADALALFHLTPGTRPVPWTVRHHTCGTPATFRYSIAVERVRTWPALLQWSSHVADKAFAAATDWHDLIARAVEPRRAAVSGILPRLPRDLAAGPVGDRPAPRPGGPDPR